MNLPKDVQHLLADEFTENPSFRTLSSFFLGGVFLLSLQYIVKSPGLQWIFRGIGRLFKPRSSSQFSPEQLEEDADEKARLKRWIEETFCGQSDNMDPKNIVLILTFFAANASLSLFGSTLMFMKGQDAVCTFTITWGGLSAQMVRITGFIRLSLDIRTLGSSRWEMYLSWLYMVGLVVLMMFHNAIASGILLPFPRFTGWALCYRQHYPLTAWILSLSNILFEFYAIFRLAWLLAPAFMTIRHQWRGLKDMRLAKALSLFLMDILTTVPCVVPLSTAAEYIPFALSAVFVLMSFNHERARAVRALSRVDSIPSTRMLNLGRDDDDSMMIRTIQESLGATTPRRSGTRRSMSQRRSAFRSSQPFSLAALAAESQQNRAMREIDTMVNGANSAPLTPGLSGRRHSSSVVSLNRRRQNSTVSAPIRSNGFFSRRSRSRNHSSTSIIVHLPSSDDRSPSSSPNSMNFQSPPPNKHSFEKETWPVSPDIFGFKVPPIPSSAPPAPPKSPSAKEVARGARSRTSSKKTTPRTSSDEPRVSRSHSSSNLSTKSRGDNRKRSSNWTAWLSAEGESPNMYERNFTTLRGSYGRGTAKSDHTFGAPTGRSTARSSKVRFSKSETSRPDAMATILPYYMPDTGPTSPMTAPISRNSIVPVVDSTFSYVVPHGARSPPQERNAVTTGVARDRSSRRVSTTRVRFGARPLRSAVMPEGPIFREDALPREVLDPPGGSRTTSGKSK
ncbi:hypothetical protein CPB86DRAFT_786951 [Serendipita vermifera]|nr:hypothetical protein CPB86DRAFT_786951 [Serendipita vermifera]